MLRMSSSLLLRRSGGEVLPPSFTGEDDHRPDLVGRALLALGGRRPVRLLTDALQAHPPAVAQKDGAS